MLSAFCSDITKQTEPGEKLKRVMPGFIMFAVSSRDNTQKKNTLQALYEHLETFQFHKYTS